MVPGFCASPAGEVRRACLTLVPLKAVMMSLTLIFALAGPSGATCPTCTLRRHRNLQIRQAAEIAADCDVLNSTWFSC